MKFHTLIAAMILFLLMAPRMGSGQEKYGHLTDPQQVRRAELTTKLNAYQLQAAAEAYAEHNNGIYPGNLADALAEGLTVIDFLPGELLLRNAFTLARTEPVDGAAGTPGQIGYTVVVRCGNNVGYTIDAWGKSAEILSLYHNEESVPCPEPADSEATTDASEPTDPDDSNE